MCPAVLRVRPVAFGFPRHGAGDDRGGLYGPVTDNAQSVFRACRSSSRSRIKQEIRKAWLRVNFEIAKHLLEENDGCGNTFKATAKPVLIGTRDSLGGGRRDHDDLLDHHAAYPQPDAEPGQAFAPSPAGPLGAHHGGAMIYWFTVLATQAVTTGAYPAVEFHQGEHQARGRDEASVEDSKKVVEILHAVRAEGDVQHLPDGLLRDARLRLPRAVLLHRLPDLDRAVSGSSRRCSWPTRGAWDNAKKVVEVDLKETGTSPSSGDRRR